MNAKEIDEFGREKFNQWIPLGKIGIAEDIRGCVLVSDKAAYVTATEIYVDGGYKELPSNIIPEIIDNRNEQFNREILHRREWLPSLFYS